MKPILVEKEYLELVPERPSDIPLSDFSKFKAWRPHQREAIAFTLQQIDQGYDKIVTVAPTGFGKSLYAMALTWLLLGFNEEVDELGEKEYTSGRGVLDDWPIYDKAYVVTATKQLQDQYLRDFSFIKTIKGRSNYPCAFIPGLTAAECIEKAGTRCPVRDSCPYLLARAEAVRAPVAIHNYAYYLNALNYTRVWPEADITIFDEGHLAEKALADFVELRLSQRGLKRLGLDIELPRQFTGFEDVLSFLKDTEYAVSLKLQAVKEELLDAKDYGNAKEIKELSERIEKLERMLRKLQFLMSAIDETWVIRWEDSVLSFRPVWVRQWGHMLLGHSEINLFMSATISWKTLDLLGVDRDEVATIEVPAIFPPERRPIVIPRTVHMSHKRMEQALKEALQVVDMLLDLHFAFKHKGLIHTANKRVAEYIKQNSRHRDRLIVAHGKDREQALETFLNSEGPLALVSPSLEVGTDLKYDQGRFQIIVKIPFPNLGDEIVARRFAQDKEWFDMVTSERLVQAYGRTNRAEDDYSITYIIDSNIYRLLRNQFIPEWFREAVLTKNETAELLSKLAEMAGKG